MLEPVDAAPALTPEEEDGLRTAITSLDAGRGIPIDKMRSRIDAIIRR